MPAHPDFARAFAAGLATGTLPPGLTARDEGESTRRFAVYRNNVAAARGNALARRFPAIERLVGRAFFTALARDFAQAHPPATPVMMDWGGAFPGYLAACAALAAWPYMADVARIELARGRAYHAADAAPLGPKALAAAAHDPGAALLALHPSVQVLQLADGALSVWEANQPGVTPGPVAARGSETALILRTRTFAVPVTRLGAGDAAFLSALLGSSTLLAAAEDALRAEPRHDPQLILARLFAVGALVAEGESP